MKINLKHLIKRNHIILLFAVFLGILTGYGTIFFLSPVEIPETIYSIPIIYKILGVIILFLVTFGIFCFPEIGLVLCLIIGSTVKALLQPFLAFLDITVFLFIVTFAAIILRLIVEKKEILLPTNKVNLPIILFVSMLILSLFYTPMQEEGIETVSRFIFLTLSIMYGVFLECRSIEKIKRLLIIFQGITIGFGVITLPLVLMSSFAKVKYRAVLYGSPPIAAGLLLVAGLLSLLGYGYKIQVWWKRVIIFIIVGIAVMEIVATDTRQVLLSLFAGMIFLLILERKKKFNLALIGILFLIGISSFWILPEQYTARYALITNIGSGSVFARLSAWKFILTHFADWFFRGAGVSGFAYFYCMDIGEAVTPEVTPHHLLLDVFSDVGFFGVIIFFIPIFYFLIKANRLRLSGQAEYNKIGKALLLPLFIYLLSGFTGGLTLISTRPIWFLGGLILATWNIYTSSQNHDK